MVRRPSDPVEYFWSRVRKARPDECWLWTGHVKSTGYGLMGNSRKSQEMAHRFSARLAGLDIAGRYVLHSCDVPLCVNPAHLSVGDHEQNMRDMASRGRASRGEGRPTAKLTQDQAIQILKRLEAGESKTAIASAFGVDRTTVHYISTGRLWSYLRGEAFAYLLKEAGW